MKNTQMKTLQHNRFPECKQCKRIKHRREFGKKGICKECYKKEKFKEFDYLLK